MVDFKSQICLLMSEDSRCLLWWNNMNQIKSPALHSQKLYNICEKILFIYVFNWHIVIVNICGGKSGILIRVNKGWRQIRVSGAAVTSDIYSFFALGMVKTHSISYSEMYSKLMLTMVAVPCFGTLEFILPLPLHPWPANYPLCTCLTPHSSMALGTTVLYSFEIKFKFYMQYLSFWAWPQFT